MSIISSSTCASKGHHSHSHEVDDVSLRSRELC